MSTAGQVIQRGLAKSSAARPETMAGGNSGELIVRLGRGIQEVFQVLARENPNVLGAVVPGVPFGSGGWSRPANALKVVKILADVGTIANPVIPAGQEIFVVPFDDQQLYLGSPCVTEFGQMFLPTAQAIDPSGGTVTIYICRQPNLPVALTDPLDALYPSAYESYLEFDIAAYAAKKDERDADVAAFNSEKSAQLALIVDWSRDQTNSLVQRWPLVQPPVTNTDGGRQQPTKD